MLSMSMWNLSDSILPSNFFEIEKVYSLLCMLPWFEPNVFTTPLPTFYWLIRLIKIKLRYLSDAGAGAGAGWAVMAWKFLNSLFSRFSCWAMINSSGSLGHYSAVRGHLTNTSIQQMKTSKCWCFNAFLSLLDFRPESWRDAVLPTNWLKVGLYFEGFPEM